MEPLGLHHRCSLVVVRAVGCARPSDSAGSTLIDTPEIGSRCQPEPAAWRPAGNGGNVGAAGGAGSNGAVESPSAPYGLPSMGFLLINSGSGGGGFTSLVVIGLMQPAVQLPSSA